MAFWDVKYEADVKPNEDGWTVSHPEYMSVLGGILTIDSGLGATAVAYKQPDFDFSVGVTVKFRAKVIASSGLFPFYVWIGSTASSRFTRVYLLENEIKVSAGAPVKLLDFDTTDTFHTYKIVIFGTTATLYIDNVNRGSWEDLGSTGDNYIAFGDGNAQSSINILIDYFYYAGSVDYSEPIVDTDAATGIKNVYCTGNGDITDDGGEFITEHGFEYGEGEEVGNFCVRKTGDSLGGGEFSLTLVELKPETLYYYRAYATNVNGDGYGSWVSFTTGASPGYGIYEESNSLPDSDGIYANSNTICFYVRRAGGKWSIKHGPYTSDQADIEIGKILTEGKGKYQIKFTSDVLTGLSVNIMTKLDIKARS